MPNSADKSPDDTQGDQNERAAGASMSDPDLDDLDLAMPEFRVPSRGAADAPAPSAGAAPAEEEFEAEPTHRHAVDDFEDEPTHSIDVKQVLKEDREAPPDAFDRAELVKTVRMDAFDRAAVESGSSPSWEIEEMLDDQRYAPDVLILPPRVLTKRWQDGATRTNGVQAPAAPAPAPEAAADKEDPRAFAATVKVDTVSRESDVSSEIEIDDPLEIEELTESKPPPPKPAEPSSAPPQAVRRPDRARHNTGPLATTESAPSPQSQQEDDDLSGIVQELLEEKKAKPEPARKPGPKRDDKRINWFNDVFTEEYFRTLPGDLRKQTEREAKFIHQTLGLQKGARLLDLACGFGRHSLELAQRDYEIAGLDVSMPMLQRALQEAQRRGLSIKFVHGDMRELNFNGIFDAVFCWQTSFGYFDDRTNVQVAQGVARALKPGGRFLLDLVNRDYVVGEMPSRTWWEGRECVFLEEVEFDNHFSVLHTKRSFIYEDGSPPREFSSYIRLYSLHELRQLLHFAGFRVIEVTGELHHRGAFLGPASSRIIVLAEKVVREG